MIQLPTQYQWLSKEPGPKMLIESVLTDNNALN